MPEILEIGGISEEGRNGVMRGALLPATGGRKKFWGRGGF